jgi:hypothetical protein
MSNRTRKTVRKIEKVNLSHLKAFQVKKRNLSEMYDKRMQRISIEVKTLFRKMTVESELLSISEALNGCNYHESYNVNKAI